MRKDMSPDYKGFDDHLDLKNLNLEQQQLIGFFGVSGSGKTTAMGYLQKQNLSTYTKTHKWLYSPTPVEIKDAAQNYDLLYLDEILTVKQFLSILTILKFEKSSPKIVMTSHLPLLFVKTLLSFSKHKLFQIDKNIFTIKDYLTAKGMSASPEVLTSFHKKYKSSYTDLELILEFSSDSQNFDDAYYYFHKFCSIKHHPNI